MERERVTKKRITDVFRFLSNARMSRMLDDEKVRMIQLLRQLKPVAIEVQDAANDAIKTAHDEYPDNQEKAMQIAEQAVQDLLNAEVETDTHILTAEGFERLVLSNDWTLGQIDEIEQVLVVV